MADLFTKEPEIPVSTELATIEATPLSIIQAAVDKGVDPQQLAQLMDLQERWERNRAAEAFGAAVTKFQSLCPVVHKSREAGVGNFKYSYASFDDVMRQATPALKECGLAVSFSSEHIDNRLKITCRIRHGTHFEDHCLTVPVPSDMKVNDTQKYGAALKYAQRYSFCAALNIVTSDEDGDAGNLHEAITEKQAQQVRDLLFQTNSDAKRFLKWAGVDCIEDLSIGKFHEAIAMLEAKPKV